MSVRRSLELARVVLLFGFGLAVALYYGRRGFMPLDQSICFDGGWRVLQGQVPLRDYTAPNGFTVHAMQAAFFAVLGVTWFAYCFHAAVVNGAFVVLVDRLLVLLGLERWASSVLALCSALLLYPPFGVPYMDQHAFFFSLAAIVAAVTSAREDGTRKQRRCALAVVPLLALAYASKQIPTAFLAPVALAAPLFAGWCLKKLYRWYAIGAAATLGVVLVAALALRVDWHLVDTYWRRLPSEEGVRRLGYVPSASAVLVRFVETLEQWQLRSAWIALCTAVLAAVAAIVVVLRDRTAHWRLPLGAALASLFLLGASLLFVALTSNQKQIGVALVFASFGCALAAVVGLAALASRRFPRAPWFARGFIALFALLAVDDTLRFTGDVVADRRVIDLVHGTLHTEPSELPDELAYLRWGVPLSVRYTPTDLRELTAYLRERPGNFWLLSDASVLYGITGKRSISPALWFHPGLTFPRPSDDPEFARYEATLLERIERNDVRTIVTEGEHTWIGYQLNPGERPPQPGWITLDAFPRVATFVAERKSGERSFGSFRVIELK